MRLKSRRVDEMRKVNLIRNLQKTANGSVLIEFGDTKVICSATIENKIPTFLRNSKSGWISAEYSLLPGSTFPRTIRDSSKGKVAGRSHEIQRLIGRSLRAVVDLKALGERTIWLDCDVLQADGGTRTASITGAWFALFDALMSLENLKKGFPLKDYLAAISVGIVDHEILLDLDYSEDNHAEVDLNLVLTGKGKLVEIQGTSEREPFSIEQLNKMIEIGQKGISELISMQKQFAGEFFKEHFPA